MNSIRYWAGMATGIIIGLGIGTTLRGRAQQGDPTLKPPPVTNQITKPEQILASDDVSTPMIWADGMVLLVSPKRGEIVVIGPNGTLGTVQISGTGKKRDIIQVEVKVGNKHRVIRP